MDGQQGINDDNGQSPTICSARGRFACACATASFSMDVVERDWAAPVFAGPEAMEGEWRGCSGRQRIRRAAAAAVRFTFTATLNTRRVQARD